MNSKIKKIFGAMIVCLSMPFYFAWAIRRHPLLIIWYGLAMSFVILGVWCLYKAGVQIHTALNEESPTQIQADRFAEEYRGQQWLRIEGRLLAEYAVAKTNDYGSLNVDVPLAPHHWQPDQPLHVVCSFAFRTKQEFDAWKEKILRSPQYTLSGVVIPSPRYEKMFPSLQIANPVVFVNDAETPNPWADGFILLAVGSLPILIGLIFLRKAWPKRLLAGIAQQNGATQ
jgi:hypothetical protein